MKLSIEPRINKAPYISPVSVMEIIPLNRELNDIMATSGEDVPDEETPGF